MSLYLFLLRSTDHQLGKQGFTHFVTNSLNWGGSESRVSIAVVGLPRCTYRTVFRHLPRSIQS